jgi:hypothetical protein
LKALVYDLSLGNKNSNAFYDELSTFTEKVFAGVDDKMWSVLEAYSTFRGGSYEEEKRVFYLEGLAIGVYWLIYMEKARSNSLGRLNRIGKIAGLRNQSFLKRGVDLYRKRVNTKLLLKKTSKGQAVFDLKHLKHLLLWLKATGEHFEITRVLNAWYDYIKTLNDQEQGKVIQALFDEAIRFEKLGQETLGVYTQNVESWIKCHAKSFSFSEHVIFCSKPPLEYHLNFFGAQVLNAYYHHAFYASKHKMILVPKCMADDMENCQAFKGPIGLVCKACQNACRVHKLKHFYEAKGISVVLIPHSTTQMSHDVKGLGIVGVACALNLLEGGYKAIRLGLIPQCVLLDYPGCEKHWHDKGLSTRINEEILYKIIYNTEI